jgi:hypothetical protein
MSPDAAGRSKNRYLHLGPLQMYRAVTMHTAVTASSAAATRCANAIRDRALTSSDVLLRRLLIARPPMVP